jgi:HSP20 family molecular chaperone IbpA
MKSGETSINAMPARPRAGSLSGWATLPPIRDGFWTPPTNVFETVGGAMVQIEVAGLQSGSYKVHLDDRRLRVEGSRPAGEQLAGCVSCRQVEIAGGRFRSEVELPWPADGAELRSEYRDGFIFVELSPSDRRQD